jgi:D-alanyl-D-alanine carboxypeptidase
MPNLQDILPPGIDPAMLQQLMQAGGGGGPEGGAPMPGPGPISGGEMMPSPGPQSMPEVGSAPAPPPPEGGGPQTIPAPGQGPEQPETGLNPAFEERFTALRTAIREQGGDLYIFAGARTKEEQQQLLHETTAKYGDVKEAMKRVKAPGKSSHDPEYGVPMGLGPGALGADIRGDLHLAHKLAPHFGLVFPSQGQPWHMEYAGLDKIKT